MKPLSLVRAGAPLKVLCIGAHSDDIEIGAGGTILTWLARTDKADVLWCALSGDGARAEEARKSAEDFLHGAGRADIVLGAFRDSYFPYEGAEVKAFVQALRERMAAPDIVLTHRHDDAHQDHRLVSELTWNTFRDSLILEYEIPKWDGDLGRPNAYVALTDEALARKIALLDAHFGTQRSKAWFDEETFRGLARLRGVECRARYAEAFYLRKALIE